MRKQLDYYWMRTNFEKYLPCCFYQNRLPLGFVTSPMLSDIYLHKLDEYFAAKEDIIYTRYADDFIISATGEKAMDILRDVNVELISKLNDYSLEENQKKTYIRQLKQNGDAIRVLGLNIVYVEPGSNRISVSDKFIREISINYCYYLEQLKKRDLDERELADLFAMVYGKMEYVRCCSLQSYAKLQKMLSVKLGRDVQMNRDYLQLGE